MVSDEELGQIAETAKQKVRQKEEEVKKAKKGQHMKKESSKGPSLNEIKKRQRVEGIQGIKIPRRGVRRGLTKKQKKKVGGELKKITRKRRYKKKTKK